MGALALSLALAASPALPRPPTRPGTYRRAAPAADGIHIAVVLYLPEQPLTGAPLVVLLPDLGTTHQVFDLDGVGLARALVARGLPVASLDWRGTGLSQIPPHAPTLDDLLQLDLPQAADVLGPHQPLVLLGWGYSGALAYAAAASGPLAARVRGVIGLDAVVRLDVPNPLVERLFSDSSQPLDLAQALAARAPERQGSLFDLLWVHGAPIDPDLVRDVLARAMAPISGPQVAQIDQWMHQGHTRFGGNPYPGLLGRIRAPVLALTALRDNWTHPEFAGPIRDHLPRGQLVYQPVTRFEGFDEDLGHLGLVLGRTSRTELVPRMVQFIRARTLSGAAK